MQREHDVFSSRVNPLARNIFVGAESCALWNRAQPCGDNRKTRKRSEELVRSELGFGRMKLAAVFQRSLGKRVLEVGVSCSSRSRIEWMCDSGNKQAVVMMKKCV